MTIKFTHWLEPDGKHLGYLNDFPEHWTQGESLEDLRAFDAAEFVAALLDEDSSV